MAALSLSSSTSLVVVRHIFRSAALLKPQYSTICFPQNTLARPLFFPCLSSSSSSYQILRCLSSSSSSSSIETPPIDDKAESPSEVVNSNNNNNNSSGSDLISVEKYEELVSNLPSLSVKEKKELASYAHSLGKKLKSQQVGKSGVTVQVAEALVETLEANELLKVILILYY